MDSNELKFIMKMQDDTAAAFASQQASARTTAKAMDDTYKSFINHASGVKDSAAAVTAHSKATKEHESATKRAVESVREHIASHKELREAITESGKALIEVFTEQKIIENTLGAYREFEVVMRGVTATANLSKQGMHDLQQGILDINEEVRVMDIQKIASFAQIAGELGVRGASGIKEFAEAMSKLDANFNIGTAGANTIGSLLVATGEGTEKAKDFANALTYVSSISKASVPTLIEVSDQLQKQAGQFHLTSDQLLGYASVIAELHVNARMAAVDIGAAMSNLNKGAAEGSSAFDTLSHVLGMTTKQFADMVRENPTEAFNKFLSVVKSLRAQGIDTGGFLSGFNINGEKAQGIIGRLADRVGDLDSRLEAAKKGFSESMLDDKTAAQNATYSATLQALSAAVERLGISFGAALAPAVIQAINLITMFIDDIRKLFELLPPLGQEMAAWALIGIPGLVALRGVLLSLRALMTVMGANTVFGLVKSFGQLGLVAVQAAARLAGLRTTFTEMKIVEEATAGIGAVGGMTKLAAGATEAAVAVEAAGAAAVGASGGYVAFMTAVTGVSEALAAGVASLVAWPVLVVAGVAAVGVALYAYWDTIKKVFSYSPKEIVIGVLYELHQLFNVFPVELASSFGKAMVDMFSGLWGSIKTVWNYSMDDLITDVSSVDWGLLATRLEVGMYNAFVSANTKVSKSLSGFWNNSLDASFGTDISGEIAAKLEDTAEKARLMTRTKHVALSGGSSFGAEARGAGLDGGFNKSIATDYSLTKDQEGLLDGLYSGKKDRENLSKTSEAFIKLKEVGADDRGLVGGQYTQKEVDAMQELLDIKTRLAALPFMSPADNMEQTLTDALAKSKAITQEQKNALAIENQMRTAEYAGLSLEDQMLQVDTLRETQAQDLKNAYDDQIKTLNNQLDIAKATTQEERDRFSVLQEMEAFQKAHGNLDPEKKKNLETTIKAKTQQDELNGLKGTYDSAGQAQIKYTDDLKILNKSLADGAINGEQYRVMLTRLQQMTLAQRDPWAAQLQSMQEAINLARIQGGYADADRQTLEKQVELHKQGIDLTTTQVALLKEYNRDMADAQNLSTSGLEGWMKGVKTLKEGMMDAEVTFVDGLSSGIADAVTGGKNSIQDMLRGIGRTLIKLALDNVFKSALQQFGLGNESQGALDKAQAAAKQLQSIAPTTTAEMTVTANVVNINPASFTPGAGLPTLSNPSLQTGGSGTSGSFIPQDPSIAGRIAATRQSGQIIQGPWITGTTPSMQGASIAQDPSIAGRIAASRNYDPTRTFDPNHVTVRDVPPIPSPLPIIPKVAPPASITSIDPNAAGLVPNRATAITKIDTSSHAAFLKSIESGVMKASKETGIDARIIAAQAAHESFWGKKAPGNNFFGLKGKGDAGRQLLNTHEEINGVLTPTKSKFAKFSSPEAGIEGYANFINRYHRYDKFKNAKGMHAQLSELGRSGYATDSKYLPKVSSIAHGSQVADFSKQLNQATKGFSDQMSTATQKIATQFPQHFQKPMTDLGDMFKSKVDVAPLKDLTPAISSLTSASSKAVPALGGFDQGIEQLLTQLTSGGKGGGGGGVLTSLLGSLFHEGGIVGSGGSFAVRNVPTGALGSLPRYHSGMNLKSDEMVAILQKGEMVTPAKDVSRAASAMRTRRNAGTTQVSPTGEVSARGSNTNNHVSIIQNISTPDIGGFRSTENQRNTRMHAAVQRSIRRNS